MFFSKRKANEEIKQAVELTEDVPEMPAVQEEQATMPAETAPLFVKVDKYKEILSSIQEMKIFISATRQIFSVMYELESIRGDALKILKATLQRLEKSVAEIDTDLLRPRGFDSSDVTHGEAEVHQIEGSLTELQKQLADLRRGLQEMK